MNGSIAKTVDYSFIFEYPKVTVITAKNQPFDYRYKES